MDQTRELGDKNRYRNFDGVGRLVDAELSRIDVGGKELALLLRIAGRLRWL